MVASFRHEKLCLEVVVRGLLGVATCTGVMGSVAQAFVQPESGRHEGWRHGVKIGQKVIRPEVGKDQSLHVGFLGKGGPTTLIKKDRLSGAVRLVTGRLSEQKIRGSLSALMSQAKQYIQDHNDLFGFSYSHLTLNRSAVHMGKDVQFLKFKVNRNGIEVRDATVDFRFKHGRLVQVVNKSYTEATVATGSRLSDLDHRAQAVAPTAKITADTEYYRVVADDSGYQLVKVVNYQVEEGDQSYTLELDSRTGDVHELRSNSYNIVGRATADVYPRWYGEELQEQPLREVNLALGLQSTRTNELGDFDIASGVQPSLRGLLGKHVWASSQSSDDISQGGVMLDGDQWQVYVKKQGEDAAHIDKRIAQNMVYYHTDRIVRQARKFINASWFDQQLLARVNLGRTCNAHWDGSTINFYSGDEQCANSGTISDVIYHEWGHGLDDQTGGIQDSAFSEGFGDIMSIIMNRSPILGIGFFVETQRPVRDMEPDKRYPDDVGESHAEGLIIASTFWDLFVEFKELYGEDKAADLIAQYAFQMIYTASTYRDVYDAVLVIDDDDDNLLNGTPHRCVINRHFVAHGLAEKVPQCRAASIDNVEFSSISGDGDAFLEPGESFSAQVYARNNRDVALDELGGFARVDGTDAVVLTQDRLEWKNLVPRSVVGSEQPLVLEVGEDAVCGSEFELNVKFDHSVQASVVEKLTIGRNGGVSENYVAQDLPKPVRDNKHTYIRMKIESDQWGENTVIQEARLKFDVEHTYIGDLQVNLVSPGGQKFAVYRGRGSDDHISFDEDLSEKLRNVPGAGYWVLDVYDSAFGDEGQVNSVELEFLPAKFICD